MTLRIREERLVERPLRRSRRRRMIAGVCGGLAEWLRWDATVVRVLFVVFAMVSKLAPALLLYVLLWVLLPEDPRSRYRILEPWEDPDDL